MAPRWHCSTFPKSARKVVEKFGDEGRRMLAVLEDILPKRFIQDLELKRVEEVIARITDGVRIEAAAAGRMSPVVEENCPFS